MLNVQTNFLKYKDSSGNMQDSGMLFAESSTDTTLTKSGVAADAKITGDRLTDLSEEIADLKASQSQIEAPKIVSSVDEMTDPTKHYVLDGYIYQYGKTIEEIVIPGETITTPAKAVIIHGYRYSHSGKAFSALSGCASLIIPVEFDAKVTNSNPVELWRTNAKRHQSYSATYYGTTPTAFTVACVDTALNEDFYGTSIYNIPAGKGFIINFLATTTTDGSDLADASFTFNGQPVEWEMYFDSADASKATHATSTTSEGTTEIITTEGFYNTGVPFTSTSEDYEDRIIDLEKKVEAVTEYKSKIIAIDSDMQALESSVSMTVPQLKKDKTLAFSGIFNGTLSEISIVQGEGSGFTEAKCVVTATTITVIKNSVTVYTAEHGLTFGSYFSIVLATKNLNKTKAYLSSGGDTFTSSEFVWDSSRRAVKLYTNVPFPHYQFSFGSSDFDKKLWMYGDSYFGHWMTAGINRGYTNCLVDGYSGGGSSAGLASFRIALEHGTPSKVVWCLGMNDGDKGTINQSWLDSITAVKEICDEYGIELVVTTIPNVPSVDNTYKNAYIRENFNYIDVSKYVGAEESTSWYTGLLSSDNVHPSTEGDFYIANIMETYLPEMLEV